MMAAFLPVFGISFSLKASELIFNNKSPYQLHKIVLNENDAKKLVRNKLIQLKLLYQPYNAPYAGMVTQGSDCLKNVYLPDEPSTFKKGWGWHAQVPAAADKSHGHCGNKVESLWKTIQVIFCYSDKTVYEISAVSPKKPTTNNPFADCR